MSDRFTLGEVERVAHLARLALTGDEKALFARQLAGILEYVEQVQAVDTDGVPPTSHPNAGAEGWRADIVGPSLDRDAALAAAPDADRRGGFFKVPRVLGS